MAEISKEAHLAAHAIYLRIVERFPIDGHDKDFFFSEIQTAISSATARLATALAEEAMKFGRERGLADRLHEALRGKCIVSNNVGMLYCRMCDSVLFDPVQNVRGDHSEGCLAAPTPAQEPEYEDCDG